MFWPCFYTCTDNNSCFCDLYYLSNILDQLMDFGNIMIIALSVILVTSFTILPLLVLYFPKITVKKHLTFSILKNFYHISISHTKKIIMINIIFFIISLIAFMN